MEQSKKSILCVDDNRDNCELMTYLFEEQGFEVTSCESLDECSIQIRKNKFSAIILGNWFREGETQKICEEIRWFDQTTPIVFYSGEARPAAIENALASGATAYLVKPDDFDKLVPTVVELAGP